MGAFQGLGVRMTPTGTKTFVFKYRFAGMTLVTYDAMSLADAHEAHAEALKLLRRGFDPGAKALADRKEERRARHSRRASRRIFGEMGQASQTLLGGRQAHLRKRRFTGGDSFTPRLWW